MSKFAHIFLGGEHDPKPVFRDEVPDAFAWPEGAVMAVTFTEEQFSGLSIQARARESRTEFFGEDGWPIEFGSDRKLRLAEGMKLEFQVFPWGWRSMGDRDWSDAEWDQAPAAFKAARRQAGIARKIVALLPEPT